jgi:hypothetical protein
MHQPLSKAQIAAINAAPESGIDRRPESGLRIEMPVPEAGAKGSDDWFYGCATAVFGNKETGQLLHLATGWPRTSCYAFVTRDPGQRRKPPVEFLRILFRSDHGAPFHDAFMDGCNAAWWLDREREAEVGRKVLAITDRGRS